MGKEAFLLNKVKKILFLEGQNISSRFKDAFSSNLCTIIKSEKNEDEIKEK